LNVQVKLYGLLRRHHPGPNPGDPLTVELPDDATVADTVALLNLPEGLVFAAALNGIACDFDRRLRDNDRVGLFPPAAGGILRLTVA
jgi:molybdopterin converting factor small subunit